MSGHTDSHSHGSHGDGGGDIIPESSIQDKALVLLAAVCLISLLVYGFQWALGTGA